MFERNRIDNHNETLVAVEIKLADGEVVAGRAVLGNAKGVHKLLEGDDAFLYVEGFDGEGNFVPKSDIKGMKVLNAGKPAMSSLQVSDARGFDPYRILGLEKGVDAETIRAAYHRLTKVYHPDRFAGVELPKEVAAYVEAQAKNVNAAYRALKHVGQKTAAVWEKR
jgi:hypothetical protein